MRVSIVLLGVVLVRGPFTTNTTRTLPSPLTSRGVMMMVRVFVCAYSEFVRRITGFLP